MMNFTIRNKTRPCLILILLAMCNLVLSDLSYGEASSNPPLRFKAVNNQDLVSIGEQVATAQDSQGFMWFGGTSGLARYDGNDAKIYRNDPQDPHSLGHNYVHDLLVDAKGRLWVATRGGGLNLYDPLTDGFIRYQNSPDDSSSLSHDSLNTLFERKDGRLWIATVGGGLNLFEPSTERFIRYQHDANDPQSLASNKLRDVYEDHEGIVWIGSYDVGLIRFDPNTERFRLFAHDPSDPVSISHWNVWGVYEDSMRRLWVGTHAGLSRFDKDNQQFVHYGHVLKNNPGADAVASIAERSDGLLWITTEGAGLSLFNATEGRFVRDGQASGDPAAPPRKKIVSSFKDRSGDWWFGHFPSGVSQLDLYASGFSNYQHDPKNKNSLNHNGVLSFEEDSLGNLWIGTEAGLNYLNRTTGIITRYSLDPKNPDAVKGPPVLALLEDSFGELWVGTWGAGLSRINPETGSVSQYQSEPDNPDSISGDKVWAIYEDADQQLWLGTEEGGLNRYDRKSDRFSAFTPVHGDAATTSPGAVQALHEDRQGRIWVGTGGGLNVMDRKTGSFSHYEPGEGDATGLNAKFIWCITEDSRSRLWMGAWGGGLSMLNPETGHLIAYREKDGLPSDTVTGVLEGSQGYLWLGTEHGLSRFDPETEAFHNYTTLHGLPGNVFNRPAYLKTRNGELVFGSTEGFTIFDPSTLFEDPLPPPVVLTNFQLFNRPVAIGAEGSPLQKAIHTTDSLTLRHDQSVFSLDFAALNYRIPEMNQYAFKLEGFDQEWNFVGNKHSATYTNLDAGEYTFRVKASNSDGVWNEKGVFLNIVVLPPWYETNWFRLAAVVFVLFIFQLIYLYRTRQIRKSKQQLALQVEDRTKQLEERTKQLEEKNREIEHLANHDSLTGLPSLRLANQRLDLVLNIAKRKEHIAAVLFIDLDGFKMINDTHGHEAGDHVLVEVALRVGKIIREYDTACRIGGDEFLVILSEVENVSYIDDICERIISQVRQPFQYQGKDLNVSVSIGCAHYPKHGKTGEDLKKTADDLMYKVKKAGKNNFLIA